MLGYHAERSLPDFHLSFGSECRVVRTARHHFSLMSASASLYSPSLSLSQQTCSLNWLRRVYHIMGFVLSTIYFFANAWNCCWPIFCVFYCRWIHTLFALKDKQVFALLFEWVNIINRNSCEEVTTHLIRANRLFLLEQLGDMFS